MAAAAERFDFKKALLDPSKVFGTPQEIVDHPNLSTEQKLELLRQWERDATALSVAEGEGMEGGEENRLGSVRRAIDRLEADKEGS